MNSIKKPVSIEHLANWFFGNFCARCARTEDEDAPYQENCGKIIQTIKNKLKADGIELMTHKEFTVIIKTAPFCKPIKRVYPECPICKALGVPQRKY